MVLTGKLFTDSHLEVWEAVYLEKLRNMNINAFFFPDSVENWLER